MSNPALLLELDAVIASRIDAATDGSYTASLVAAGIQRVAQKLGEEGVELALAAVGGPPEAVAEEAADLLYHLLVLLRAREVPLTAVLQVLEQRQRA